MEPTVTPAPDAGNAPAKENLEAALATPQTPVTPAPDATKDPNPSDPPKQEHDWKARFDGSNQAHLKLSEEQKQDLDSNVKLVEKTPELLEQFAESNPRLADQISKKLHDKSYEDYRKDTELEALKESDPEGYESEKRLRKIEDRDATRTETERKTFLESKGIKDNQFDPAYQKVKAELQMLNPQFVEDNPSIAWEKAYQLAFPSGINTQETKKAADLAANTNTKGGLSAMLDQKPSTKSPAAKAFGDKMSSLTGE